MSKLYNAPSSFAKNPYISQVGATGLETFLGTLAQFNLHLIVVVLQYTNNIFCYVILNVDTKSLSDQAQGVSMVMLKPIWNLEVHLVVLQQLLVRKINF